MSLSVEDLRAGLLDSDTPLWTPSAKERQKHLDNLRPARERMREHDRAIALAATMTAEDVAAARGETIEQLASTVNISTLPRRGGPKVTVESVEQAIAETDAMVKRQMLADVDAINAQNKRKIRKKKKMDRAARRYKKREKK